MKNLLITTLIFFALSVASYAQSTKTPKQTKKRSLTPLEQLNNWRPEHDDCLRRNRYTLTKRLSIYPFNKAAKVLAVSYHYFNNEEADIIYDKPDSSLHKIKAKKDPTKYGIKIVNGVLDTTRLVEIKKLTPLQIEKLTDLLYNTGYKVEGLNSTDHGGCFMPRNAFYLLTNKARFMITSKFALNAITTPRNQTRSTLVICARRSTIC
ncbi:hypothetical protein LT679_02335 [Mucilaginibacter roseus]|uniref:Uncharacterized protein n=1 Tax=Mucilaginibacter roseus TaxID=1528868 RepID=A0ABS8U028_9SPHI|nr:hypothetical protein [Mucilaginibacter roseus]MCD8739428.1 hypothetical protein [Mucilaginibacter roseus]